jgi:hypothetical protein
MPPKPEFKSVKLTDDGIEVVGPAADNADNLTSVYWCVDQNGLVAQGVAESGTDASVVGAEPGRTYLGVSGPLGVDERGSKREWQPGEVATAVGVEIRVRRDPNDPTGRPMIESYTWSRELTVEDARTASKTS